MNIDKKALKSIVDEIEASRARQKAETEHQREVMKRAKAHQLDTKAVRIVLQRRAMGDTKRDEQDYYVHAYELALGGKKTAAEALEAGATIREAAKAGGISTGSAAALARDVQKSPFVNKEVVLSGVDAGRPSEPSGPAEQSVNPDPPPERVSLKPVNGEGAQSGTTPQEVGAGDTRPEGTPIDLTIPDFLKRERATA